MRARSAGVWSPLSQTIGGPSAASGTRRSAGREIDLERLEIAVVDAEQRGVERERAGKLRLVMDLDQRVHAERPLPLPRARPPDRRRGRP